MMCTTYTETCYTGGMSNDTPDFDEYRALVPAFVAALAIEPVRKVVPTSDAFSPAARERLGYAPESGTKVEWDLSFALDGVDVTTTITDAFLTTPRTGGFKTRKAAQAEIAAWQTFITKALLDWNTFDSLDAVTMALVLSTTARTAGV